jgi:hypothetical protein
MWCRRRGDGSRPAVRFVHGIELGRRRRGMLSCWHAIADCAEGAQPLPGARTAQIDHHERIRSTGHKHVEDLGEGEQLGAYLTHPFAAI